MDPDLPRLLRPAVISTVLAVLMVPVAVRFGGPTMGPVGALAFFVAITVWAAPKVYPRGQLRFAAKVLTRLAYRRAGTQDWTTAADLYQHHVTPDHVRQLRAAGYSPNRLLLLADALHRSAHPDGPLAVEVMTALPPTFLDVGMQPMMDLPAEQRTDAVPYANLAISLPHLVKLCSTGLPYTFAVSVTAPSDLNGPSMASAPFTRLLGLWTDPELQSALDVGSGGRPADPDRLVEHLNEWISAVPSVACGSIPAGQGTAADVIASYGTVPLAGWWFAAGYSPQEAREVSAQRDWSKEQLALMVALRHGPVVTEPLN